jgi:hypothetical protein
VLQLEYEHAGPSIPEQFKLNYAGSDGAKHGGDLLDGGVGGDAIRGTMETTTCMAGMATTRCLAMSSSHRLHDIHPREGCECAGQFGRDPVASPDNAIGTFTQASASETGG